MIIYPAIELQHGRCVSLNRGRIEEPVIWHVDPVETARGFAAAGADWLHVTDFDGIEGRGENNELLERIIREAGIPVQLGGGFRTRDSVSRWIDKGAGRIVIGTMAAQDPGLVHRLAKYHPDQIVLAVDVWKGQVMTDGWRTASAFTPEGFISEFDAEPLAGIIVTDIDSDMDEVDAQLGLVSGLAAKARTPVIARGMVHTADDVARLKYIPNISGAVIGKGLFRKDIDLGDALRIARETSAPVAEFQ